MARVKLPRIRETVWHSGRAREGSGAPPLLFAFGYLDLAEALQVERDAVVAAVVSGQLDPLDLDALVLARTSSLGALQRRLNPGQRIRELRLVVPSHRMAESGPIHGLGDCWAYSYLDLAHYTHRSTGALRISAHRGLDPRYLTSLLDHIASQQPVDRKVLVQLERGPASADVLATRLEIDKDDVARALHRCALRGEVEQAQMGWSLASSS